MKNYKDYPLIGFGMSDIASLVLVYFDNVDYEVQESCPWEVMVHIEEGWYIMMWKSLPTTPSNFQSMQVG